MSASTRRNALSSSPFPDKLETCLSNEICDPLTAFGSSFGCADDEPESYGDPASTDGDNGSDDNEPAVSGVQVDTRARGLSIDRFFASDVRAFGYGGPSLSAMADEDESDDGDGDGNEDDDGNRADLTDARSLADRIFPSDSTPTRYRVALAPSLGAIEEDESECGFGNDSDSEGIDCPLTSPSSPGSYFGSSSSAVFSISDWEDFDSVRLSVVSFSTPDEDERMKVDDDPDFDWVWIEIEDGEAEVPQHVPLTRSWEAQEWRWHRAIRRFFAL